MRGIGLSISRLSAARAALAGAAILAGAALRPAQADGCGGASHTDDLAMAVPRIHPQAGANGIGLPQPLAPSEAARIRRIFALQRGGKIPEAVAETARLNDDTLLGHLLADRLLARPARASAAALSDWLGRYADLPDASPIYTLLLRRLPRGAARPAAPPVAWLHTGDSWAGDPNAGPTDAAARDALVHGRDAAAERLGREAFDRSRGRDGEAAYVAGLAAWRRNEPPPCSKPPRSPKAPAPGCARRPRSGRHARTCSRVTRSCGGSGCSAPLPSRTRCTACWPCARSA
jgi:hypothetical protein